MTLFLGNTYAILSLRYWLDCTARWKPIIMHHPCLSKKSLVITPLMATRPCGSEHEKQGGTEERADGKMCEWNVNRGIAIEQKYEERNQKLYIDNIGEVRFLVFLLCSCYIFYHSLHLSFSCCPEHMPMCHIHAHLPTIIRSASHNESKWATGQAWDRHQTISTSV